MASTTAVTGDKIRGEAAARTPTVAHVPGRGLCLLDGTPILDCRDAGTTGISASPDAAQPPFGLLLDACVGAVSSSVELSLGKLRCARFLALARCKIWWMTPEWGTRGGDLPPETQFLLLDLGRGLYAVLMPLLPAGGTFRATLRAGSGPDATVLRCESGCAVAAAASLPSALYAAAGDDPYALVAAAFKSLQGRVGTFRVRSAKVAPPSLDGLGWCTWDAFYSSVTPQSVQAGLWSFRAAGAPPPRVLILDDGWQHTAPDGDEASSQHGEARTPPAPAGALARLAAAATGVASAALLRFYSTVVERAPPGSWPVRVWGLAARTILGPSMRAHYAASGDFSHRLASLQPAAKFGAFNAPLTPDSSPGHRDPVARSLDAAFAAEAPRSSPAVPPSPLGPPAWPEAGHVVSPGPVVTVRTGLAGLVDDVKGRFGVRTVLCWHAMTGYWGGVHPGCGGGGQGGVDPLGSLIRSAQPTPGALDIEPSMAWNPMVVAGVGLPGGVAAAAAARAAPDAASASAAAGAALSAGADALYAGLHGVLSAAGVDGVKVDAQAAVGQLGAGAGGGPSLAGAYAAALERSTTRHFPTNDVIACMCHSSEALYGLSSTAVVRASDDFYPRDAASHAAHIAHVVYNSLFLGELGVPDWDQFWSRGPSAGLHAAARAVGGCAVYVSDAPGAHDASLLRRLALPSGGVLRAKWAGRPTRDCLFVDPLRGGGAEALKVWNANAVTGLVAVFNLQGAGWDRVTRRYAVHDPAPGPSAAHVHPTDVEGLAPGAGGGWAVSSLRSQALVVCPAGAGRTGLCVEVEPRGYELVTVSPLLRARGGGGDDWGVVWAPLGLSGMLNGGGAVWAATDAGAGVGAAAARAAGLGQVPGGRYAAAEVTLRGDSAGVMAAYAASRPDVVLLRGKPLTFAHTAGDGRLLIDLPVPSPAEAAAADAAAGRGDAPPPPMVLMLVWTAPVAYLQ